jgi:hypothetical protein
MGLLRVSVTMKDGVWYGNVHETTPVGGERIIPPYLPSDDGAWRAYGEDDGDRPEPAMEELLTFAMTRAKELGRSELSARWTQDGPEVIE